MAVPLHHHSNWAISPRKGGLDNYQPGQTLGATDQNSVTLICIGTNLADGGE